MFVYTIKASKIKFFGVLLASVLVLVTLITVIPEYENYDDVAVVSIKYGKMATNADRIEFIEQFGYTVNAEPCEIVEVLIPEKFDSVYENYNEVQRAQGLNLKKYKGKTAVRYTYVITNYPDRSGNTVNINLLIYKDKIIGGDVCCIESNGFMHGFELPTGNTAKPETSGDTSTVSETSK